MRIQCSLVIFHYTASVLYYTTCMSWAVSCCWMSCLTIESLQVVQAKGTWKGYNVRWL